MIVFFIESGALQALFQFKGFSMRSCLFTGPSKAEENAADEKEDDCEGISHFIAAHSSVVLTHALLVALERLAAGYLSAPVEVCFAFPTTL